MTKEEILETKSMLEVVNGYGLQTNRAGFIRCPFHDGDQNPSLKIYDKSFYCFGCGKGGDVFTFVELYEHCDFHTAFLRLGGTDQRGKISRKDLMDSYRAKRQAESYKKRLEEKKRMVSDAGKEVDLWRDRLSNAEPMSDNWTEAYNRWQIACEKYEALLIEYDKERR